MPLSTAAGSFRSSNRSNLQDDDENVECEPVPLPIQTFFWRQTNPFIGGKIGKLHEASCVTFERVVVQNILHGLSPSLSDAIQSISRWRFVRAAFPHVIQCCTALLGERAREEESMSMSGSLVKTLYILHWLLMDSATECNDMSLEDTNESTLCIRNLAFSISSVQLFVYQLIPLISLIKEDEIESHIRLESGLRIWQALWQCRPPDVLCFNAPVKQRKNPLPQVAITRKPQPLTAVEQGIYLGDDIPSTTRRMSQLPSATLVPPPKPPRTDPKVVQELAKSAQSSPQPGKVDKDPLSTESKESKDSRPDSSQPSCSIVRSISDYKTSELAASTQQKIQQMKKSRTDTFHSSPDSDAYAGMKAIDEATSDIFTDRAPLVQLTDICSGGSIDASDHQSSYSYSHSAAESVSLASQQTIINRAHEHPRQQFFQESYQQPPPVYVPIPPPPLPLPPPPPTVLEEVNQLPPPPPPAQAPMVYLESSKDPGSVSVLSEKGGDVPFSDPHEACYLDIAVIKCLLIRNWSEEGVFWAAKYLLNRLTDIRHYRSMHDGPMRNRSNSVPSIAPRGSKHSILEADYLTWADLQDRTEAINKRIMNMERKYSRDVVLDDENIKLKVAFSVEQQKSGLVEDNKFLKASPKDQRRVSLNTLPAQSTKKLSQDRPRRVRLRSKSDPSMSQVIEVVSPKRNPPAVETSSTIEVPSSDKRRQSTTAQNFYPEAIGSGPFIEKNGHLSFEVILQSLVNLCNNERCNVVRVSEIVLNICDTLLVMPNLDSQSFFEGIIKIILRTYITLGCPSGCNEGMRTPQADFLRIKAKSLLSLMHKMNAQLLTDILKTQVAESTIQILIDCLHAITVFCQVEVGPNRIRTNSSRRRSSATDTKNPSYKNNFNESLTGMEGYMINTMLTPMSSKLMSKLSELFLPENMSMYQDVRMFVAYLQENHGNPIRRSALSALTARFNLDLEKKEAETAETKSIETIQEPESRKDSNLTVPTQRDNASMRRGLFKKKEKTVVVEDTSEGDSSPSTPRHVHIPSIDESSLSAAGSPLLVQQAKKKSGGKLQFAFNLLKSAKHEVAEDENWEELDDSMEETLSTRPIDSDSRSRISFKNVAQKVNVYRQRNSLSVDNSLSEAPEKSQEAIMAQLYMPPKKMVAIKDIREGARRFSFFLETCKPGIMPDPPLIAALMELKSPVLGRAVLLLECAHFVHRCNRNDWPEWVRSSFVQNRAMSGVTSATGGGGISRSVQGGSRKVFLMQRAAGRSFYDWGVQIALRLQKFLEKEEVKPKTEEDKRKLKLFDDIEDFLDDSTVNDPNGEHCPPALQLVACLVLYQITAFLRETFQLIPRSKQSHRAHGSTSGWEKLMSHRRWSILSNTFNPQSGSIHSINEVHPTVQAERRVSYSTADEESSPRGSNDMIEEIVTPAPTDKKESALTAFRRFAYRTRQASQNPSISTQEESSFISTERDSARSRILRSQMTTPQPPPRAASPTPQHVPETVRRLAQGRQRLLKRGSPSVGQAQPGLEQSGRRQSFKKQSKPPIPSEKDSDEQEGAPVMLDANGNRKSASIRSTGSRWKMRSTRVRSPGGYSQSSIHSVHTVEEEAPKTRDSLKPSGAKSSITQREEPTHQTPLSGGEQQSSPERRSHMGSYSSSQGAPPLPQMMAPHTVEDEEEEMLRNMPWLKVMIMMSKQFDMTCTHDRFCTKWCFDRVYRQCYRLVEAFNEVYDETIPENSKVDKRKQLIDSWHKKQEFNMQKRMSKPRRESAAVRQSGVERVPLALRGLLIEKLNEIEEAKALKKDGTQLPDEPVDSTELDIKRLPMLNYMKTQIFNIIHTPISTLLKSAIIMTVDNYKSILNVSWNLLLNNDPHVVSTAASMFICCSVRCADDSVNLIKLNLSHPEATCRTEAIRRFLALWRNRFHVWLKMEDGAQLIFKVPPPSIDFTLPSPPIGQNQLSVVDPPWMPHVKTKVEELSLKEEEHSTSQTIMTMTRTRRKQKQEMVKKAIREAEERQSELRQQFPLRATGIVQQAAYEPALFHHQLTVQQQEKIAESEENDVVHSTHKAQQMPVAQPLFPSSILSVVPLIMEMLDDVQVDKYGISVGEVCKKIVWSCIVEDTALFLRHFLEKLTHKDKQEYLLSLLRKLILTFRPLPSQTAFSLLNYLFGFVMFYVRSPSEGSDKSLALALSVAWLVVPYVHGLYFKDIKQTLKKEQCDQALMITANVPSAKKIIVHGPDSAAGGIPSQFPIHEDTQFQQIFTDSLEFFNIPEHEIDQYFLVDAKTGMVHCGSNYVRDFYFFHRSFYPQLSLIKMNPGIANYKMREMAFHQKMIEAGKVLLTYNALKYSPEAVIPQRIFFLHDEFTHLPSFPRRSLESSFGMYEGPMGDELKAIDQMHKFVWGKLISDMFEKMENAFMFGDLHLFINVINGVMILHCEDVLILRRCMATFITMAIHFNTLFASQGFFLIIPTLIRCYSQRQPNRMFVQVVEFVCKQFYILHRKPFLLQMFGAIADMCDQNNNDLEINAMQVKAKYLFNLLRAMENLTEIPDQLDILALVPFPKPLKALDLCYRDDPNSFIILTDALASCVTVCAFAPESRRCHQMMLIMQSILPHLIRTMEAETTKQNNAPAAIKHELHSYSTLCVEIKALINSCETLSRAPTRTFDIVATVSDRGKSFVADSPQFFDPPTTGEDEGKHGNTTGNAVNKERKTTATQQQGWEANDNIELQKDLFRGPRDALLVLCSMFIEEAGPRLKDLAKLATPLEHIKIPDLLDHRCHVKLSEIALSLLKIAPYDLTTMGCTGLQKYFMTILPVADWSVETNRSALSVILRRLDKTMQKIGKKSSIRRRANWNAITNWLTGLYNTLTVFPYIAHLHPVKAITLMCLRITVGDQCGDEGGGSGTISHSNNPATILNSTIPPQGFCTAVLKLTSFLMQALGQFAFSLEFVCSPDGLGLAADRIEAVLCHILIPLFLRAGMLGKDAPQFQSKDLVYCLNVIHNAISPPLAKQSLAPVSSANLATSLIRGTTIVHDTTGRQGSVSVAERGHSATVSTHRIIRDSVIQCVFLALKVIILAFNKQLTQHWVKVTKIVKDIVAKKVGGQALFIFIEFLNTINLPISIMLVPIVHNKLTQKVEHESSWQTEFRDKMIKPKAGSSAESIKGYFNLLNKLFQELQVLKEDFSTRLFEVPRSHTPTLGDMHSDSGSVQSGSVGTHRSSHGRQTTNESRRLSSSTFSKFRSGGGGKPTNLERVGAVQVGEGGHHIQDTTIMEDTEDETAQMIAGKVQKSPSLPTNRLPPTHPRRSIGGGLGMWRSMKKRSSKYFTDEETKNLEMRDMMRRTKSWNKRIASRHGFGDDPVVITPLTMPETQVTSEIHTTSTTMPAPTTSAIKSTEKSDSSTTSSSVDRHRIVSFSTPKKEHERKKSETISENSEEFCITSTRRLI